MAQLKNLGDPHWGRDPWFEKRCSRTLTPYSGSSRLLNKYAFAPYKLA